MVKDANSETEGRGIPAPLLSYTRSMVEPTGEWKQVGDYAIWSGNRIGSLPPFRLHEERDHKVLPIPASTARAIMHPIKGSTWFHVEQLFGFWMKANVDTVWIDAPGTDDAHYYTLVLGGADGRPGIVSGGWLCPACGTVFNTIDVDVTRRRFQLFLDTMDRKLVAFNADATARTCPSCGSKHPESYGFNR
jgi:hypothetical protein